MSPKSSEEHVLQQQINDAIFQAEADLRQIVLEVERSMSDRLSALRTELANLLVDVGVFLDQTGRPLTYDEKAKRIVTQVAKYYKRDFDYLLTRSNRPDHVLPRQMAIFMVYRYLPVSTVWIGRLFDGRDHTTVLSALRKIEKLMVEDVTVAEAVGWIDKMVGEDPIDRPVNPRRGKPASQEQLEKARRGREAKRDRDTRANHA